MDGERDDRKMYKTTCADCGKKCEVPFKPSKGKKLFCKDCFGQEDNFSSNKKHHSDDKYDQINAKLDKILKLLEERL